MVVTWNDGQDKELHVLVFSVCFCFRREVCECLRNSVHELYVRYKTTNERNHRLYVSLPCQQTQHVIRHRSNMANILSRYEKRFLPSLDMEFVPASSCSDISEMKTQSKSCGNLYNTGRSVFCKSLQGECKFSSKLTRIRSMKKIYYMDNPFGCCSKVLYSINLVNSLKCIFAFRDYMMKSVQFSVLIWLSCLVKLML